jgi:aryl-alcohol dehydrogenase-like predicted oxidoreductase
MHYRKLGNTNWNVSEIGFGGWALGGQWGGQDDHDSAAALNKAIDLGLNFIDTAESYGDGRSERVIAGVLRTRSERVYVATQRACTEFRVTVTKKPGNAAWLAVLTQKSIQARMACSESWTFAPV